jgi:hypothetical protein
MKTASGYEQCYNGQIAVDAESRPDSPALCNYLLPGQIPERERFSPTSYRAGS